MPYLFLGIALLIVLLLAGRWFVNAKPKAILSVLKWVAIAGLGLVAVMLIFSGRILMLVWLLPALLPWIMRARHAARTAKTFSRMAGNDSGQKSTVKSAFLEMHLDHDSGDMDGEVLKGRFNGRMLSSLSREDTLDLHQEYASTDDESARLLAAYLDRVYPDWRGDGDENTTHEEPHNRSTSSSSMSRAEALKVLGLETDANDAEIKQAHHRLIAGLHPDRGGSAYLAAKINEARDVLLKG